MAKGPGRRANRLVQGQRRKYSGGQARPVSTKITIKNHRKEIFMERIIPCLWFDSNAEEAAKFYTSIFKIRRSERYRGTGKRATKSMGNRREAY
jgi:hypothetical protein